MLRIALAGVLVVVLAAAFLNSSTPASLAGDVGLRDEDVCAAVAAQPGTDALDRLAATGFPRATIDDVEIYRLLHAGVPQAAVQLDWSTRTATCLPLDQAPPWISAELDLDGAAYGALVEELKHVIETGHPSGHVAGNAWAVWWGGRDGIHIPTNPDYENKYRWELAKWAAGLLVIEELPA